MLTFLIRGESCRPEPAVPGEPEGPGRSDWWAFERRGHHDPTHPAAGWVAYLLQEAASIPLACPACGMTGEVWRTLDHLLRVHRVDFAEAAVWLEGADADLFSLAVHYLASKARARRGRDRATRSGPRPPAITVNAAHGAPHTDGREATRRTGR